MTKAILDYASGRAFLNETHAHLEGVDIETAPLVEIPDDATFILYGITPDDGCGNLVTTDAEKAVAWLAAPDTQGRSVTMFVVTRLQ